MNPELLGRLSNAPGISGFETAVQTIVAEAFGTSCDDTSYDRLGNVIGLKRATVAPEGQDRPLRVVLAAHADEIGMLVKHITPEGFIRFAPVGGLHIASTMAQQVVVHGRREVRGVIVPDVPPRDTYRPLAEMMIDVGLPRDEVVELVDIGDPVTFAAEFVQLNDKVVMGRNFDDRIGTYCLVEAMRRLGDTAVDTYGVSTVQEEVGVRGMPVAAYAIEPDIGIAIDGSLCRGAYAEQQDHTCEFGRGAGIYLMDNLTIGDTRLVKFLVDLCTSHGIAFQKTIGGGTDASALQRTRAGALSTTVGAPVRYMHSTVQLCHIDDIEATISMLTTFVEHAHELFASAA